MNPITLSWTPRTGWSAPFPACDSPQTLVLVFGTDACLDAGSDCAAAARELRAAFPRAAVTGCSTAGEILANRVSDHGLSVAIAPFSSTRLAVAETRVGGLGDSRAAGLRLGAGLPHEGLRAVLVFAPGLGLSGSQLVDGLADALPPGVVVTGGLAGDGNRFVVTWAWGDAGPDADTASVVGLYGEHLDVTHASRGGWLDFGPERLVTRSSGNIVYELDGRPALDLYKHYLGEHAAGLPSAALLFPLSVRLAPGEAPVVRTILAVDEAEQALIFAGDVPTGVTGRLMRTRKELLIESAAGAGEALEPCGPGPGLALLVSCVGRRLVLGERTEEEVEAVQETLPPGVSLVGFFSYGEIAPSSVGARPNLHNQSVTLTLLREAG